MSNQSQQFVRGAQGDVAIHGGSLEDLGSHRFQVLRPVQVGDPPCLNLPELRLGTGRKQGCSEY